MERVGYSPAEVAEALGKPTTTIQHLCQRGRMPGARKLGGRWFILRSEFEAWLNAGAPEPEQQERPPRAGRSSNTLHLERITPMKRRGQR